MQIYSISLLKPLSLLLVQQRPHVHIWLKINTENLVLKQNCPNQGFVLFSLISVLLP